MSNKFSSLAFVAALLALPMSQLFAQGARIVLWVQNQGEITGRLLSVRDSALVISTNEASDNHIGAQIASISVIKNQNIQCVFIKGKSRVLISSGLGFLIGAGTGAIIGFAAGDDPECKESGSPLAPAPWCLRLTAEGKAVIGGILGGVAGSLVGGIIGVAASTEDKAIYPNMNHGFSELKPLAKFPDKEPEYLNAVK